MDPIVSVPAFLDEQPASAWFYRRREGHVLDHHLSLVQEIFGSETEYRLRAARSPINGRPVVLQLEIMLPIDDDGAWRQLNELQERLIADEQQLALQTGVRRPFNRIVVSLAGPPRDWTATVNGLSEVDK